MFFFKLGSTPLLFTVGFSGILKGYDHLRDFFNTVVEQIPFSSWYISHSLFFSFCIPKTNKQTKDKRQKTLLSNSLGNVPASNPSNMIYPSGGLGSEIKGR